MFNNEFTFGSSVGMGSNGEMTTITDLQIKHLKEQTQKNKNIIYSKKIHIKFLKSLVVFKKEIGVGDIVDFITTYTGIKWLIIKLTKGNCGCEKRRILFNKWLTIPIFGVTVTDTVFESINLIDDPSSFHKFVKKKNTTKTVIEKPIVKKSSCGCGKKK
jgi:hypothetical protein